MKKIGLFLLTALALIACKPTETKVDPTAIALNKTSVDLEVEGTERLSATLTPTDATGTVAWSSSNTAVASVTSNGTITGVAAGTATITAKVGELTATCEVTVNEPVDFLFAQGEIYGNYTDPFGTGTADVIFMYLYEEGVDMAEWKGDGYFCRLEFLVTPGKGAEGVVPDGTYEVKPVAAVADVTPLRVIAGNYDPAQTEEKKKFTDSWLFFADAEGAYYAAPIGEGSLKVTKIGDEYKVAGTFGLKQYNESNEFTGIETVTMRFRGLVPNNTPTSAPAMNATKRQILGFKK